ncbi:MAG TPA: hypothetical protein VKS60_23045, partial [Stellaceae bacterium]|nr:hypothetical protein [Stellaceae bacterium]
MPNGTYSGSYYRIYLGSSFTNVTIEASVEFSGLAVDAVRGGSANAYTVTNYGSIIGQTFGIFFTDGGAVINKAGAYIDGVDLQGASGTIVNSGTIKGEVAAAYIVNELGGILDTSIYGYRGITVTNAGTINAGSGIGIRIAAPITPFDGTGLIINHTGGLIEGATGINVVNTTIIDYGTIKGSTEAVYLGADSELVVEVGAKLVGKVVSGGDAALEFGGVTGPGSFSGLGSGKISGSVAATLSGVDTYLIGADASWTITGANTVVSGSTLEIEGGGTLTDTGTITIDGGGVIIDDGSLSGSGSIEFVGNGGRFVLAGTAELGITLEGFAVSDQIDLSGIAFTAGDTATYTGGEFRFYNAADQLLATVHVQGELAGDHLLVVNDGAGDAEIIAVANGTYEGTYSHLTILHAGSPVTLTTSALVDATSGNAVNSGTSSAYTLINEGTVETTATSGIGIDLKDGGSVTNNLGGTIYGVYGGVAIYGGGGTVVNDGSIGGGTGGSPFDLHAGVAFFGGPGTLINTGTIEGDGQAAVYMKDGGVVTNTGSGAVIASIEFKKVPGSVVNDATIVGGVLLGYGGDVVNAVGATIGGTVTVGDYFNEPWIIGTIVNYGTIGAASFTSSGDLLVVEAGSSINGLATGGGGTFELGAGGGAGSLTGIGSGTLSGSAPAKVYGFSVYEIGSGADWTLTGSNTIAAGKTLDIASGGSLVNSGSILVAGGEIIDDGSLSGSGTIIIGPHGVVDFAAVPSSGTVVFSGQDGDLQLASLTGLGIAIEDFGPGDTIDLTGIAFAAGDTATYANGLLELFNSSHVLLAELNMTGVLAGEGFAIERDGSGGTKILANLNGTYSGSYTNFLLTATEVDVTFTSAATVTAATGNAITGGTLNAYTVVNSGHISATATHGIGIALQDGGSVSNQGGVIYGGEYGVDITGTAGAVTNTGTITGKTSYGVDLLYGGSVTNAVHGTISGGRGGVAFWNGIGTLINGGRITGASAIGDGVYFREGGYLENKKGGLIKNVGDGVVISPNGSVTNFGSIISTKDDGVVLRGSGTVLNAKGAVIEGAAAGVVADLVINYGTIESSTGYSVGFGDGTLVIEAGSELIGKASGDDGTLELGGGAGSGSIAGIGSGTLSGSTSGTFSGISVYAVGSGADWTLTGSNTIASFETLALLAGGTLVNDGTILMAGGTLDDLGVLTGPGTIEIGNRDTLTLAGAPNSGTIEFLGIGELQLADLNGLGVTIDGIGLGDTIALPGITFAVGDSVSYSGGEIEIFNAGHTLIAEFNANILPGDVVSLQKSAGGYLELVAHGSGTYTGTYSTLRFSASVPVVTIASGAEITGYGAIPAIYAGGDADYTLINYGSIVGNHNFGAGVDFNDGGVVENKAGGVITGATGVVIGGAAGTVFNAGTIDSNSTTIGSAISLTDGGTIDNLKGGLIEGGFVGIEISGAAGTVENAGTIEQGIEIVSGAVSVENSGIITGGVNLQADGNVLNAAGGYIQGSVGVWFERSAG